MKLGELTWPEVKALDKEKVVPVYPIASFEQHGPHLPLLTDTLETTDIVERLDRRLPDDVVCLPTQWLGYSFHHKRFACVTATSDTHINLITETVGCLIDLIVDGYYRAVGQLRRCRVTKVGVRGRRKETLVLDVPRLPPSVLRQAR